MVHDEETPTATPTERRRLAPVAATAAVALILTVSTAPAVSTALTVSTGVTTQLALPAYFAGPVSPGAQTFGLYREFVRTSVPVNPTPAQKARTAVAMAMSTQPFTSTERYLRTWSGVSVKSVTVTASRITITLTGPGANGLPAAQTKLAVQQLVWTAQAAVGKGAVPVKFSVATGATKLFGRYSTSPTYNRPPASMQYQVLAPIWITTPVRSQVFAARAAVVAAGQSCAFEATTQWQLKKGATNVRRGFATASSGCPTRGTWQVRLGVLAPGSYTFRMYEVSQEDGKRIIADTSKPFTVR